MSKKYKINSMKKNGEFIQQTLLDTYFERTSPILEERIKALKVLLKTSKTILDINAEDGRLVSLLRDEGLESFGYCNDGMFLPYVNEFILSQKVYRKFDTVMIMDHIEFSNCPYSEVLDALNQSNNDVIIDIPINNDPRSNFLGRSQEFSSESASIFAANADQDFKSVPKSNSIMVRLRKCCLL